MPENPSLTHVNSQGEANMVDVSAKPESARSATCDGWVLLSEEAFLAIENDGAKKGDVLATSRIAGLMSVKKTAELIPLCHPLRISGSSIDMTLVRADQLPPEVMAVRPNCFGGVKIVTKVQAMDRTGVEMEAMTALSVTALTIYDMLKAVDRFVVFSHLCLLEKTGGKSGSWKRE